MKKIERKRDPEEKLLIRFNIMLCVFWLVAFAGAVRAIFNLFTDAAHPKFYLVYIGAWLLSLILIGVCTVIANWLLGGVGGFDHSVDL